MEEVGIVTKVEDFNAIVVVEKKGTCDTCSIEGACESTAEGMEIEVLNPINAKVGQTVSIIIRPGTYIKGSMLLYGLPMILFIAGAIFGNAAAGKYFPGMHPELISAGTGFAALIISLFLIRIWSKRNGDKTEFKPYIDEIINS